MKDVTSNGGVPNSIFDRMAWLELENAQLRTALKSRIIVEQAKGAISVRFGIAPDEAFAMMRGLARSQRREIHEYAAEIVANGGRFAPGHVPKLELLGQSPPSSRPSNDSFSVEVKQLEVPAEVG